MPSFGVTPGVTLSDSVVDGVELGSIVLRDIEHDLDVAPATIALAGADVELAGVAARERRLRRLLEPVVDEYDVVFIDCPPSLGLLTVNALTAADAVLIPLQSEYYALEGLTQLLATIDLVRDHLNPRLAVDGVVITMADGRTNLSSDVEAEARELEVVHVAAERRDPLLRGEHQPDVGVLLVAVQVILAALVERDHVAALARLLGRFLLDGGHHAAPRRPNGDGVLHRLQRGLHPFLLRQRHAGRSAGQNQPPRRSHGAPQRMRLVGFHHAAENCSFDTRVAMSTLAVKNCLAVLEGKPPITPVT